MNKYSLHVTLLLSMISVLALAASDEKARPYPATNSYAEIFTSMDAARAAAIESDRLLLYVLGANWCHDSLGLVEKMHDPQVRPLIEERYQVQLINVGFLQYIREVTARYDIPIIYGTPTVMVIEPHTNTLLNRNSLPYWRNADMIGMEDTVAYFEAFEPGQPIPTTAAESPALQSAMQQIAQFEAEQAERIYTAYAVLGPMLKNWDKKKPNPDFEQNWRELAEMRSKITADLSAMRDSATVQAASGNTVINIEYPEYPLFID
jgi:hypothetical protein